MRDARRGDGVVVAGGGDVVPIPLQAPQVPEEHFGILVAHRQHRVPARAAGEEPEAHEHYIAVGDRELHQARV